MGVYFAENLSGSCIEKGCVIFSSSGCLREHVMFGKGISVFQKTLGVTVWPCLTLSHVAGPCWVLLT